MIRKLIPTLFTLAVLLSATAVMAEDPVPATGGANVPVAGDVKAAHNKTIWQTIQEGGVIMVPLAGVSVAMFSLIGYGIFLLRKRHLVPDAHVTALRSFFSQGDYAGASRYCRSNPGFFSDVIYAGLCTVGQGKDVCEESLADALSKAVASISTRFYYLNLIGVVTPMLGLTGTVLGMMRAFSTLGASGIGDPSALAGAIGEVLVATATGLFVAIPAFTAYYVFRNWATGAKAYCEDHVNALFRSMPYAEMTGLYYGDEPLFAALPKERYAQAQEDVPVDDGTEAT